MRVIRSTRPLAWGERAQICWIPSSTMVLMKLVASTGGWMCLGFPPGRVAKQRGEGMECGYNRVGQGEHCLAFSRRARPAYPVLIIYLAFVQSPDKDDAVVSFWPTA